MTNPSFQQHLSNWKWAVLGRQNAQIPLEILATSADEFQNWQAQLLQAKIASNRAGYTCQFNKGGTASGRMAAWIKSGGFALKISYTERAKQPKGANVKATSVEAYYDPKNTDTRATQKDTVAAFILWKQNQSGESVCRNHIWEFHRDHVSPSSPLAQMSNVARSVNEIIKDGFCDAHGVEYRLEIREHMKHGDGNTPVEHFMLVKCEPAPESGVQSEMF